jgi:hypothetical protein
VQLRLESPVTSTQALDLAAYTGLPERDAVQHPEGYFLWPLRTQRRGVILPGPTSRFALETRWYPLPGNPTSTHREALAQALTAFSILGTIGTRATRGYGSVWDPSHAFESPDDLSQALDYLPSSITVRILEGNFDDGRQALAAAARWMRSLRIGSDSYGASTPEGRNDHDVADPGQREARDSVVFRQALGMPLAQRFRRDGDTQIIQSKYRTAANAPDNDRYPSPVRVKVIRLCAQYRVLIIILHDLLLPAGTQIVLTGRDRFRRTVRLDHSLLTRIAGAGVSIH